MCIRDSNKNDNVQYTLIANMPAKHLTMYEKRSGTGTTIEYLSLIHISAACVRPAMGLLCG